MKQAKENANSKKDKLFSKTDIAILVTTIVLCVGLELSSVLPVVENNIYEYKYTKLKEMGHTDACAKINAKAQTQNALMSLYFLGLGAGLMGMGAMYIKKGMETSREFKRINDEWNHIR